VLASTQLAKLYSLHPVPMHFSPLGAHSIIHSSVSSGGETEKAQEEEWLDLLTFPACTRTKYMRPALALNEHHKGE